MTRFAVYQCTNPSCNLRFPAEIHTAPAGCPRCHQKLQQVRQWDVVREWERVRGSAAALRCHGAALLDNLRSVWNVGSIFRTADAAGLRHLYLCGITPTPENPALAKTALGAETWVPWSYHANALALARHLHRQGWYLIALETTPSAVEWHPDTAPPGTPWLLIVGNEKAGVDPELLDLCHVHIRLPMRGRKSSLNVAVAFGIAAYTLSWNERRQIQPL